MTVANFFLVVIEVLFLGVFIRADTFSKKELISQWAPVVWLAPDDKYLPLSVEEFLSHVEVAQQPTPLFDTEAQMPYGPGSEQFYLVTRKDLGTLLNDGNSFLHGRNPTTHNIPVYTIVTPCSPNLSFHSSNANRLSDNVRALYDKLEPNPHFHVVYWMFFPYNEGKEICVIGKVPTPIIFGSCLGQRKIFGNHVGDWEHISLSFNGNGYPDAMYVSVHDAGVYYKYDVKSRQFKYINQVTKKGILQRPKFPKETKMQNNHPVVFSAKGSHGLWSAPGNHYFVKVPRLTDENGYGIKWETWRNLKIYFLGTSAIPSWMKYKGKWGNPQSNCFISKKLGFCEVSDGPTGILERSNDFNCSQSVH
ncbi:uncharacterized protein LOC116167138 isoform X2 [Photinus pyralis]|uniref:uncharacterized protein LOC116167138 isoform X2 n=1 Tax=Photinus pyralis TaxID=7054 RepID=UPI0012678108|nr:uncharacterized protein LOC116167138 isoform X2 [Photinus pyralis]